MNNHGLFILATRALNVAPLTFGGKQMEENKETLTTTEETGKTFTQDEVNAIIDERLGREREKYADYEDLKAKVQQFSESSETNQKELNEYKEKTAYLQKQLDALNHDKSVRELRSKVAKDTGVPEHLLTGDDEKTCKAQAEAILKFANPSYPGTKKNTKTHASETDGSETMRELARTIFNKGE